MSKQLAEQATTPASLRWRDLIRRKDDGAAEIHRPAQANLRTIAPGDEASETVNSMSSGSVPRFRRVRLTFAALRRCQMHDGAGDGGGDDGDGDAGNGPRPASASSGARPQRLSCRMQFQLANAGRDIDARLPLQRHGLKRHAALRSADQHGSASGPCFAVPHSPARVCDDAGPARISRSRHGPSRLLLDGKHQRPELVLRRSIPSLRTPLSTLRLQPHDRTRMTRGRCGSLRLHRNGLAPSTFRRSPGAPVHSINKRHRSRMAAQSAGIVN